MDDSKALTPLEVARLAAEAARSTPGVVGLHGGEFGEAGTYWQGQKVPGVQLRLGDPPRLVVRVVAGLGWPLPELAEQVRQRVLGALPISGDLTRMRVDVHILDLHTGGDSR